MINANIFKFVINPFITNFFDAKTDKADLSAKPILYYLKNGSILRNMLKWKGN